MPTEGHERDRASAPSARATTKADYSNWGVEQTRRDRTGRLLPRLFGTPQFRTVANQILGPYPQNVARAKGR